MPFSKYQRGILERLREVHRVGGPSWSKNLRFFRNQWLFSAVWTAGLSWALPEGWPAFVGLALGAFSKDIAQIRTIRSQWSVMNEVIDWERVDHLLDSSDSVNG